MRTDSIDVNSLVSYINDIKPFHSKLTEVTVEYQANDNLFVNIQDKSQFEMQFSSVWELHRVSDGIRTQYRIPAAVFPRYSDEFHQSTYVGVTGEVPGVPGAYPVPYNNGVTVKVNGTSQILGIDYTLDPARNTVQFINNSVPEQDDNVDIIWAVVDRVFIGLGTGGYDTVQYDLYGFGDEVVWQSYDLEYSGGVGDGLELFNYDTQTFDSSGNPILTEVQTDVTINPFGKVRVIPDSKGRMYYVFEFFNVLPLDTKVWIRVEQREAYNGWTQTTFKEHVQFADIVRFYDTVNAWIVDPGTWNVDQANAHFDMSGFDIAPYDLSLAETMFGIDISTNVHSGNYDIDLFDLVEFDSIEHQPKIGYYKLFTIHEYLQDHISVTYQDVYSDLVGLVPKELAHVVVAEKRSTAIHATPSDHVSTHVNENETPGLESYPFDSGLFDMVSPATFVVSKKKPDEVATMGISEGLNIIVKVSQNYDSFMYDTVPFDSEVVLSSVSNYSPDASGMVYVNDASNSVMITHSYGYNPGVAVYWEGQQLMPLAVDYPQVGVVIVKFSTPRVVVIHLA